MDELQGMREPTLQHAVKSLLSFPQGIIPHVAGTREGSVVVEHKMCAQQPDIRRCKTLTQAQNRNTRAPIRKYADLFADEDRNLGCFVHGDSGLPDPSGLRRRWRKIGGDVHTYTIVSGIPCTTDRMLMAYPARS